ISGYIETGETWVRLTDFAAALGFTATWDSKRRIPVVCNANEADGIPPLEIINENTLKAAAEEIALLKTITHWEARGEDEKGQTLVVNVIFNRLDSPRFPNTLREVVFAQGAFTPTTRPDFDTAQPNARTIAAVNKALGGVDFSQGATFFHALRGITPEVWHERAVSEGRLIHLFDHGGHRFYREA
ncbi:MAG: cell wall hydrolase, partial [Defluviitaleaceae bacterium]|nr:cell wall hydrolase [Defluviitaleaceae bacterium]